MTLVGRVCKRGLWDESVPGILFDEEGVSNYAHLFDKLCDAYPRGKKGKEDWEKIVAQIRKKGNGKKYDCIIGVSGGTDSSYLLHLVKEVYKLKPLAVTFDNGWSSEIAVRNIKKVTNQLRIDLETYVVDYEEMKDIHKAYMRASLPWIDKPTDFAIKNILYQTANQERIKFIFVGHDFRSEGTQPNEWTHGDSRQLNFIVKNFGTTEINSLPYLNYFYQTYLMIFKDIKIIKPYYYLNYSKRDAQNFLINNYDWNYYGGHHHENIFTKFAITYWLLRKFNIDKRKITLSAQVLSEEITRYDALNLIGKPPYDPEDMERDKEYIIKKLGLNNSEFEHIWHSKNKKVYDYPSYLNFFSQYAIFFKPIIKMIYKQTPTFLFQMENRKMK